jgi:predicted helicase
MLALRSFAVCSAAHVGKRVRDKGHIAEVEIHDLAIPDTTDAAKLAHQAKHCPA